MSSGCPHVYSYFNQETCICARSVPDTGHHPGRMSRAGPASPIDLLGKLVGLEGEDVNRKIPQNDYSWGKGVIEKARDTKVCNWFDLLKWAREGKQETEARDSSQCMETKAKVFNFHPNNRSHRQILRMGIMWPDVILGNALVMWKLIWQ